MCIYNLQLEAHPKKLLVLQPFHRRCHPSGRSWGSAGVLRMLARRLSDGSQGPWQTKCFSGRYPCARVLPRVNIPQKNPLDMRTWPTIANHDVVPSYCVLYKSDSCGYTLNPEHEHTLCVFFNEKHDRQATGYS